MLRQVCAFWEDAPEADGFVRVTRMHHQPEKLDAAMSAAGAVVTLPKTPKPRKGWTVALWVHPGDAVAEWRVEMDEDYRMSAAEFLLQIPVQARIQARAAAAGGDAVLQDFLDMIDRMIADNANMGLHPGSLAAKVALAYLVEKGWMTEEDAAAITEP